MRVKFKMLNCDVAKNNHQQRHTQSIALSMIDNRGFILSRPCILPRRCPSQMSSVCRGCGESFRQDYLRRKHLALKPVCQAAHDHFIAQLSESQLRDADFDDPEQWGPPGLHDPEPRDDFLPPPDYEYTGRIDDFPVPGSPSTERPSKRTRSGTLDKSSLVKVEIRPFPNAATVIRKKQPIPWEEHVSSHLNIKMIDLFKVKCKFQHQATEAKGLWPEYPFRDQNDWSIAHWLGTSGLSKQLVNMFLKTSWIQSMPSTLGDTNITLKPSFSSADELYQRIDCLPGGPEWKEKSFVMPEAPEEGPITFYWRDPVECLAYLQANPVFRGNMNYVPVEQYADEERLNRIFSEPHTAKWVHRMQALYPTDSINGILLASDDTHLTNFSGDKKDHPVLISSTHISKSVRAKPGRRAFMLMARIPHCKFAKLKYKTATEAAQIPGILQARLFHHCMTIATQSLQAMDKTPVEMVDSYGDVRKERCFLAGYIADLKEQKMIGCIHNDHCVCCLAEKSDLGTNQHCEPRTQQSILDRIHEVQAENPNATLWEYVKASKKKQLFGVDKPFWEGLPHVDICEVLCSDVLHGLHKAFKDHTAKWTTNIVGDSEFDQRMRQLPKFPGFRHFTQGISKISQWSGKEHKDLQRYFLGAAMGCINPDMTKAIRAELDFIYTAQFKSITKEDLDLMDDFIDIYHDHKDIFHELGGRDDENYDIPKLHNRQHFRNCIERLGTTDNYNTETSERYHIEIAKRAWKATNHRNYVIQMCLWLERQEKVYQRAAYLHWLQNDFSDSDDDPDPDPDTEESEPNEDASLDIDKSEPEVENVHHVVLTKNPAMKRKTVEDIASLYKLPELRNRIMDYCSKNPDVPSHPIDWRYLDVWSQVKVRKPEILELDSIMKDDSYQRILARLKTDSNDFPCFQTVLVDPDPDSGEIRLDGIQGFRIAQIRLIFRRCNASKLEQSLAYVEWFTNPTSSKWDDASQMFSVDRKFEGLDRRQSSGVIELDSIVQHCPLLPRMGKEAEKLVPGKQITGDNCMELCDKFRVNCFHDQFAYKTLW